MKERADRLLVALGLAPTREKAQALIMAGLVYLDGRRVEKPGHLLAADARPEVRGKACPYVSRGGLKLQGALEAFDLDVSGLICADIGASTGGFTDCLLQRGASRVYAVDVGRGQMDATLRADPRVVLREGVNARGLTREDFPEELQLVVVDASFISLKLLLPAIRLSAPAAKVVALVKPQFEAGRGRVGRGGVVRDEATRAETVAAVRSAAEELGYTCLAEAASPLKGPKGNVEFFLHLNPGAERLP